MSGVGGVVVAGAQSSRFWAIALSPSAEMTNSARNGRLRFPSPETGPGTALAGACARSLKNLLFLFREGKRNVVKELSVSNLTDQENVNGSTVHLQP